MKHTWPLLLAFFLFACQPQPISVFLLDGTKGYTLTVDSATPASLAAQAGLNLSPSDVFLLNGQILPASLPLPQGGPNTLQILHAVNVTLLTPDSQTTFESAAPTIGQALQATGLQLFASDLVAPPPETPLTADITVIYRPARDYTLRAGSDTITVKSSGQTVGQVLASAGMALIGLDYSHPGESDPAPANGQIEIIRVREALTLEQKSLPFSIKYEYSSTLAAGAEQIITPGEPGLSVSSVRVRYENDVEVSRVTEGEQILRQPAAQVVARSSQVDLQTLDLPGGQAQYWRAAQMWATSYSPCRSGTSKCSYGTASGMPVQQGVVAMTRDLYNALGGSQVYIPGYGLAVIADVGGGFPDGRLWVDLGYSDSDWQNWGGWVTVYFLAPAPAYIPATLQ